MTREQLKQLEDDLWSAAVSLRANSGLGASQYSTPVLGLIFLKFADINYRRHETEILAEYEKLKGGRRNFSRDRPRNFREEGSLVSITLRPGGRPEVSRNLEPHREARCQPAVHGSEPVQANLPPTLFSLAKRHGKLLWKKILSPTSVRMRDGRGLPSLPIWFSLPFFYTQKQTQALGRRQCFPLSEW